MRSDGYSIVLSGDIFILYYYPDINLPTARVMIRTSFHIDDLYRVMLQDKMNKGELNAEIWIG